MGQTLIFAATFLPSFLLGRASSERFRHVIAGLLPDTFGGLAFYLVIAACLAMTIDGVIGSLIPDYLYQPVTFLLTGFGAGTFLTVLRGMFRPAPTPPAAILPDTPRHRPSSALPPDDFFHRPTAT